MTAPATLDVDPESGEDHTTPDAGLLEVKHDNKIEEDVRVRAHGIAHPPRAAVVVKLALVLRAADQHLLSRAKRRTSWAALAARKCACMTRMTHAINLNAEGPLQTGQHCEPCPL